MIASCTAFGVAAIVSEVESILLDSCTMPADDVLACCTFFLVTVILPLVSCDSVSMNAIPEPSASGEATGSCRSFLVESLSLSAEISASSELPGTAFDAAIGQLFILCTCFCGFPDIS